MPSLLDRILDSKENPSADTFLSPKDNLQHQLPDGEVIYDSTIAAINRILTLNPHLHKRQSLEQQGAYQLYNGHTPVDLADKKTFLSLLRSDWVPPTPFQVVLVEKYVTEFAPSLSLRGFFIAPNLLWDMENATLIKMTDEELKQIRTVS